MTDKRLPLFRLAPCGLVFQSANTWCHKALRTSDLLDPRHWPSSLQAVSNYRCLDIFADSPRIDVPAMNLRYDLLRKRSDYLLAQYAFDGEWTQTILYNCRDCHASSYGCIVDQQRQCLFRQNCFSVPHWSSAGRYRSLHPGGCVVHQCRTFELSADSTQLLQYSCFVSSSHKCRPV